VVIVDSDLVEGDEIAVVTIDTRSIDLGAPARDSLLPQWLSPTATGPEPVAG
jgi:hypothetical protein